MTTLHVDEPKKVRFRSVNLSAHDTVNGIHDNEDGEDIIISYIMSAQNKTIADAIQLQSTIQKGIDNVHRKVKISKEKLNMSSPNAGIKDSRLKLTDKILSEMERCAEWNLGLVKLMNDVSKQQQMTNKLAELIVGSVHTDGWLSMRMTEAQIEMLRKTTHRAVTRENIRMGKSLRKSAKAELEIIQQEINSVNTRMETRPSQIHLGETTDFGVTQGVEKELTEEQAGDVQKTLRRGVDIVKSYFNEPMQQNNRYPSYAFIFIFVVAILCIINNFIGSIQHCLYYI